MKSRKNSIKIRISSIFALSILLSSVFLSPFSAYASKISVANQDDVYGKLESAAKINVIMNNLKKCFNAGSVYNYTNHSTSGLSGADLAKGSVFYKPGSWGISNTDHSTSLWLENAIGANESGSNGALWCWQGQDNGVGLMQQYQQMTKQPMADIVCNAGKGRIFQRAKYEIYDYYSGSGWYIYDDDVNCSSMNDTGAVYLLSQNWEAGLKASYDAFKASADNQYLPSYDEIGLFNNIDGYFNYLLDFNFMCSADDYATKPDATSVTELTTYNRSDKKIVATTKYYHVKENKSWDYSLSADNPVKSCQGLLDRIHELENKYNGVYDSGSVINTEDDRRNGYEGIILAKLKKACDEMKDQDGKPAYDNMLTKLQKIIDDESATDEEKTEAQTSIDKINKAKQAGTFVEIIGKKTDPEGQTFQCLDISQMEIIVNEYEDPLDEIGADGEGEAANEACYKGAGAMGWLLCPIISSLEGLMDQVYSFVEEHFLKIRANAIFNGDGSMNGVHEAWSKLQAIANVIFIIFFLAVLFSQITGVGISNYGIKKMLPKLIVTAVLINLSYIICAVLVDLSNIVGVGLRSLLESGLGIPPAQGAGTGGKVTGFLVAGSITITSLIVAVCLNPGLVVTFLLFLGSAALAVLFLWLILVIREVVIVLGIVLAPVAFACSALPNTESLFKKWIKIMEAMLLLYPLCSLVVGGGQFAGRILANVGQSNSELGWTFNLAAMIAQVVPFFAIPGLLKGALAGLGTLGARLAQGQRALNANTVGRIRNSDRYKDFQMRSRAGLNSKGELTKRGRLMNNNKVLNKFSRGTNAARASYLGRKSQLDRLDKFSDEKYLAASRVAEENKAYDEEVSNALTLFKDQGTDSKDLLAAVDPKGGAQSIAAIQRLYQKKDYAGVQQALDKIDVAGLSVKERTKLGETLADMQSDDILTGLYGKKLLKGETYSFKDYANGAESTKKADKNGTKVAAITTDLQNVDGGNLGSLDDNVYTANGTINYSEVLRNNMSGNQWAELAASTGGLNQKNLNAVNENLIKPQAKIDTSVFSGASTEQAAKISESTLREIDGGKGNVQQVFRTQINDFKDAKNANIVAGMGTGARGIYGIITPPAQNNQNGPTQP